MCGGGSLFAPPCCHLASPWRYGGLQNHTVPYISAISSCMHDFVLLMCLRATFCRGVATMDCRILPSPMLLCMRRCAVVSMWYQFDGWLGAPGGLQNHTVPRASLICIVSCASAPKVFCMLQGMRTHCIPGMFSICDAC